MNEHIRMRMLLASAHQTKCDVYEGAGSGEQIELVQIRLTDARGASCETSKREENVLPFAPTL